MGTVHSDLFEAEDVGLGLVVLLLQSHCRACCTTFHLHISSTSMSQQYPPDVLSHDEARRFQHQLIFALW